MAISLTLYLKLCWEIFLNNCIPQHWFPDKQEREFLRDQWHEAYLQATERLAALRCMVAQRDRYRTRVMELEREVMRLRELATTDPLTGLANRRGLNDKLHHQFSAMNRAGCNTLMAMITFDIDHFKQINDRYGHDAGDRVLVEVAALIRKHVAHRPSDIVARIGGDEFLVVLPDASAQAAWTIAQAFCQAVAATSFAGIEWQVTVSCGVADMQVTRHHTEQTDDLIFDLVLRADRALYTAKTFGRNRVEQHVREE